MTGKEGVVMNTEVAGNDLRYIREVLERTHRRIDPHAWHFVLWGTIVLLSRVPGQRSGHLRRLHRRHVPPGVQWPHSRSLHGIGDDRSRCHFRASRPKDGGGGEQVG